MELVSKIYSHGIDSMTGQQNLLNFFLNWKRNYIITYTHPLGFQVNQTSSKSFLRSNNVSIHPLVGRVELYRNYSVLVQAENEKKIQNSLFSKKREVSIAEHQ